MPTPTACTPADYRGLGFRGLRVQGFKGSGVQGFRFRASGVYGLGAVPGFKNGLLGFLKALYRLALYSRSCLHTFW